MQGQCNRKLKADNGLLTYFFFYTGPVKDQFCQSKYEPSNLPLISVKLTLLLNCFVYTLSDVQYKHLFFKEIRKESSHQIFVTSKRNFRDSSNFFYPVLLLQLDRYNFAKCSEKQILEAYRYIFVVFQFIKLKDY